MDYALFLQLVTKGLEQRLGEDYIVTLRSIPKNNGVTRDGISVCHKHDQVAPTIYLNDFYQEMKNGRPMEDLSALSGKSRSALSGFSGFCLLPGC